MFKFLRRSFGETKPAEVRPATKPRPSDRQDFAPAPLPEVIEGDGEADWSLWEDSVNSQLQPLSGFRDTESGDAGAFDKVGRRDR